MSRILKPKTVQVKTCSFGTTSIDFTGMPFGYFGIQGSKSQFCFVWVWDFFRVADLSDSQILGDSSRSFIEVPRISKLFFRFSIPAKYLSVSLLLGSGVFRGCSDVRAPRLCADFRSPEGSAWPRWFPRLNSTTNYFGGIKSVEEIIFLK